MTLHEPRPFVGSYLVSRARAASLDRLRGLAVVCMLVDHLVIVFHGPYALRLTVGRLAMPLFFVLAGHLVKRLTGRHVTAAVIGALLPLVVPWIDAPNVLVVYALGAVVLVLFDSRGWPVWPVIVAALAMSANGYRLAGVTSYDVLALVALMAAGRYVPRASLERLGGVLPGFLAGVGRWPLTWYVGHLLVLQAVVVSTALVGV